MPDTKCVQIQRIPNHRWYQLSACIAKFRCDVETFGSFCSFKTEARVNACCWLVTLHALPHVFSMLLHHCERPGYTPIQNNKRNYSFVYFNLHIFIQQTETLNQVAVADGPWSQYAANCLANTVAFVAALQNMWHFGNVGHWSSGTDNLSLGYDMMWNDMVWYKIWYDIFVNRSSVDTRWQ